MKQTIKIFVAIAVLFNSTLLMAQYDPKAKRILDAMSEKYKQIPAFKANFSYKIESTEDDVAENVNGNIVVKKNKYKIDLGEQTVFNDEENVWVYLKEVNEVTITEYEPDPESLSPTEVPNMYKEGFKYRFVEEKKINGSTNEIIELNPEDTDLSYFKIELSIDKQNKTLHSWKFFYRNGRQYTYYITDFKPDPKINDNVFVFNEADYDDVDVVDLR